MKLAPSQAEQLPKRSSPVDTSTIDLVCIFTSIQHHQHYLITIFPHAVFFQKYVSQTAKTGAGNYNLLYENPIRKYEDSLRH